MMKRILVSAAFALLASVPGLADEPICVVIHQTGIIRNATPDEARRGMRFDCELTDDNALNFYLAHGGH